MDTPKTPPVRLPLRSTEFHFHEAVHHSYLLLDFFRWIMFHRNSILVDIPGVLESPDPGSVAYRSASNRN